MKVKCVHDCRFVIEYVDGSMVIVDRRDRDSEWLFMSPQGHMVRLMDFAQVMVHLSCCMDEELDVSPLELSNGIKGQAA